MKRVLVVLGLSLIMAGASYAQEGNKEGEKKAEEKSAKVVVDGRVKAYEKVSGVSGNLNSVGSDTLNNLMVYWAEDFRKKYPNVKIQIEGKGSSTAPPALTNGTSQLGPMSRKMKPKEIDGFVKKFGFKPTRFAVAVDCVAVYVNKDNPIKGLSLKQVDAIFSKTYKLGGTDVDTWGKAGLDGNWKNLPIRMHGRNSASGTYAFFKEHAMKKGDYKDSVKKQPGSAAVINAVAKDRAGIGYSGIGYKTSEVRALPIAKEGDKYVKPTFEAAMDKSYPLGRSLYVYVVKKPNEQLPLLTREFMKFVMSHEGQEIVIKDGYGPLPYDKLAEQLKVINEK